MLKIVTTGPESTGKTTLSKALADFYQAPWVPEYARIYLEEIKPPPYQQEDIFRIAKGQLALEEQLAQQANRFLFCDTSLVELKIWSEFRYQSCERWLLEELEKRHYDLFLLCGIDIPWEYDPLRENPMEREILYAIFKKELQQLHCNFIELHGDFSSRFQQAQKAIEQL